MSRYLFIDLAKGIAIICVVFDHAAYRTGASYLYNSVMIVSEVAIAVAMPFFFMISAVFLKRRFENENFSDIVFLKKITSSILIPFYTLSFLFLFMNLVIPKSSNAPDAKEMVKSLLVMQSNRDIMPSGVLWFLFVLFVFALCTYIFIKILKVNPFILFVMTVLLKIFAYYFDHNYFFAINKISQFYVYYVAGYLLSEYIVSAEMFRSNLFLLSLFVCATIFYIYLLQDRPAFFTGTGLSIWGISSSLLLLGCCYKIQNHFHAKPFSKLLQLCGENSILIYVFHTSTFVMVIKIIHYMNLSSNFLGFVVVLLSGVALPFVYGWILSYNATLYNLFLGRSGFLQK
jgi:fucose 4-O-acetylase-like acetyltransferase